MTTNNALLERVALALQRQLLDKLSTAQEVKTAKQEELLIAETIGRVYGYTGSRLAKKLISQNKIRSVGLHVLIEGYLIRAEREWQLTQLIDDKGGIDQARTQTLLARILSEDVAKSQHATLHKVAPDWIEAPKSKADPSKVGQSIERVKTTRSQQEVDAILGGTVWSGAILAANAEQIPQGFARLTTLELLGVAKASLSNPIRAVLEKDGLPQIYIRKGYYREDFLKACALKLREPARTQLQNAIDRTCGNLIDGEVVEN
jgi:hypothetical protein